MPRLLMLRRTPNNIPRGVFDVSSPPDTFETPDTSCAAFLVAKGHQVLNTRVLNDGRTVAFTFDPAASADAAAHLMNAPIPSRTFVASRREVFAMVNRALKGIKNIPIKESDCVVTSAARSIR